ncbi:MAG: sulfur oxidation c-type cytochrome SoxA, partial [Hyphomicrobiaceae bacterium]
MNTSDSIPPRAPFRTAAAALAVVGVTAAVASFVVPATADDKAEKPYRDMSPMVDWVPHVTGDEKHTKTYQYWKDRSKLPMDMARSVTDQWKTNWKFMDPTVDDSLHGGHEALARGEEVYAKLNADGGFAKCLGAKDGELKGLRANGYPRYDESLKKIMTLEMMIEHCSAAAGGKLENGSYDNAAVSVYIGYQSNGMPVNVDVSKGELKAAFERGKQAYHTRVGVTNFSCATCHADLVGQSLRGQVLTTPYGDSAHWPTFRTKGELQAMHVRFSECNRNAGAQPLKPGSAVYADLEVFVQALSNGYPVDLP